MPAISRSTQAAQLKEALDALAGDEFVMGDHI